MGWKYILNISYHELFSGLEESDFLDKVRVPVAVNASLLKKDEIFSNWRWDLDNEVVSVDIQDRRKYTIFTSVDDDGDIEIACTCSSDETCSHIVAFWHVSKKRYLDQKQIASKEVIAVSEVSTYVASNTEPFLPVVDAILVDAEFTKKWCSFSSQERAFCTFLAAFGCYDQLTIESCFNIIDKDKKSTFLDRPTTNRKITTLLEVAQQAEIVSAAPYRFNIVSNSLAHAILDYQSNYDKGLFETIYFTLKEHSINGRHDWQLSISVVFSAVDTLSFYMSAASGGGRNFVPSTKKNALIAEYALNDPSYVDALPKHFLKQFLATNETFSLIDEANMNWFRHAEELLKIELSNESLNRSFVYVLLEAAAIKGDIRILDLIVKTLPDSFAASVALGWKCFITGDYVHAANIAAAIIKKIKTAPEEATQRYFTVWLLRVMTDIQTKASSEDVRKHLNSLITSKFGIGDDKKFSEALPLFLDLKIGAAETVLRANKFTLYSAFFKCLMLSWMGEDKVSEAEITAVGTFISPSADYLQRELILIKQRIGIATDQQLEAVAANEKKHGWAKPMLHFFKPMAEWEAGLSALLRLGGVTVDNVTSPRIIWLVDTQNGYLTCKEQKPSKSGWTTGREVGSQSIAQNAFLDHFDKTIVHEISKLSRDYFYYQKLKFKDVVFGLVGHPRLFLANSPETQVQFVDEPVTISIKDRDDDNYEFGFNISFNKDIECIIAKETPTKYRVYKILKEHKEVLSALGKERILIPKSAKDTLEKVISHVGSLVEIQSTAGDMQGSIPEIEADATIYAQVVPIGQGFIIELFVRPLSSVPTYCIAGQGDPNLFGLQQDKSRVFCMRDLKKEAENLKKVVSKIDFLKENKPSDNAWLLDSDEACLGFLSDSMALIDKKQLVVEWPKGEKYRVVGEAKESNWDIKIKSQNDWFSIEGSLKLDEENVLTMQELVQQIHLNGRFIKLNSGHFMSLTKAFEARIRAIAGLTQTNKKSKEMTMHSLAAGAMNDLLVGLPNTTLSPEWTERIERISKLKNKKYPLPKGLNAELRNYQKEGFSWLSRLADWGAGACLADDMGLGKTLQVQAILLKRGTDGPALVVAPASVVRNWVNEINKFTPSLMPLLFSDTDDRQKMIKKAKAGQIIIVTYNLLQREAELFASKKFTTIVLDEAQAIKNAQTKRSDVVKNLQADFKIITTGTPIENHLGELWSLFEFINPGFLGTAEEFSQRFVGPIERDKDEDRRNDLRRLIQPFMLRRLKKDHLKELPGKTEILLSVELSKDELAFYEALRRDSVRRIEEMSNAKPGEKGLRVLAELTRLRQACCNPRLIDEESTLPCSKLRLFDETVTELIENGHKALVFSQFVTHLSILREHLDQKGISYQYLDGSTPTAKRQENIDAFQRGEGDLFLISLKAGGAGINLTAADYVIHMDPWWNPAVEDQATDRAHRMGQTKPVTVYRLITAGTIEEKIVALHDQKRDLADSLLEGTDISARLNTKDLIELMKLG
jgi:SNF2 family DNA or RNA helicase